jgi:hypothetical protein
MTSVMLAFRSGCGISTRGRAGAFLISICGSLRSLSFHFHSPGNPVLVVEAVEPGRVLIVMEGVEIEAVLGVLCGDYNNRANGRAYLYASGGDRPL